ncbi:hypothetical protein OH77DRAFT_1128116 [Trametes cingulata]|nr:hypothetical protein OH77DRAFT_1128116 [Trametes cingulata]
MRVTEVCAIRGWVSEYKGPFLPPIPPLPPLPPLPPRTHAPAPYACTEPPFPYREHAMSERHRQSPGPWRQTRSGAIFSPWGAQLGAPIHAPDDFDLDASLREALETCHERPDQAHQNDNMDVDAEQGLADVDWSPSETALASLAQLQKLAASRGQDTAPTSNELASKTKDQYHDKMRSKARRRRKQRAVSDAAGDPGVAKKGIKNAALKRRQAADIMRADVPTRMQVDEAVARDAASTSFAAAASMPTDYSLAMDDVPVTKTAYVAKRGDIPGADPRVYTKEELLSQGFEYVAWNGRDPRAILDKKGRIVAVLVGRPRSDSWDTINEEMQAVFELAREAYQVPAAQQAHRRGNFTVATSGISYGGGQTVKNMTLGKHNQAVMDALLKQLPVERVARFGSRALELFAPRLHAYYEETMKALCENDDTLHRNFEDNPFANVTFNLGPQSVCLPHRDHLNLAWGMCAITAFGDYDPVERGHFVMWEFRKIIEFPPTSTIFIMSGLLGHSNTAIAEHEHRYSLTQYSAGGLFRWAEAGFKPVNSLSRSDAEQMRQNGSDRWERGVGMLSLWDEFQL